MSQTQATTDDQPVTEKHEKDVVITAYADDDYEDRREFIDAVLGEETDTDVLETKTVENHNVELELSVEGDSRFGTREYNGEIRPFTSADKEAVANALDEEDLPDWLTFTNEKVEEEQHEVTLSTPIDTFIGNTVDEDVLDDLGYDHSSIAYTMSWSKQVEDVSVDADEDDTINHDVRFNARGSGVDQRQKLVHQSDRSKANQYESEDEFWSFEIRVHLEAETGDTLDEISERLVPVVYEALFGLDEISAVRLTSCEQNVSKIGECYNF